MTGSSTGESANPAELKELLRACSLPILIGSGVTKDNFHDFKLADGMIVGSYFKEDGHWRSKLSDDKVNEFMRLVNDSR